VIICGKGGRGGEGGAEDADVVVELGGGPGAIEEEGELVLRVEIDVYDAVDEGAVLLGLLVAPGLDGLVV
jgi:hypothetical protein